MRSPTQSDASGKPLAGIATAFLLSLASALHAQPAETSAYLTDMRGNVVRNATYLCWHTGYWTPAAAIAECDPDLVSRAAPALAAPAAAAPAQAPAPISKSAPASAPAPVMQKVTLSAQTLFDFDKSVLKPDGRRRLDELLADLRNVNLDAIIAVGHADSIGSDRYNQKLSLRRAGAVKAYLVGKAILANRVTAQGNGEKQPVGSNKTREGRAKNRRVEVEVVGTGNR